VLAVELGVVPRRSVPFETQDAQFRETAAGGGEARKIEGTEWKIVRRSAATHSASREKPSVRRSNGKSAAPLPSAPKMLETVPLKLQD
jgi:hypothetical protein